MGILQKSFFWFCLFFCCLQTHAQFFKRHTAVSSHKLIASNEKKTRRYMNGDVLKIRYYNNGEIVKAKGRLLIDSTGVVEIISYRRKPIIFIPTDSIYSISRWNRRAKISLGIMTGAGIVLGTMGVLVTQNATIADDYSLLLFIPAALSAYALAIAAPITFISEWASMRSQKRGYHFYIQ